MQRDQGIGRLQVSARGDDDGVRIPGGGHAPDTGQHHERCG
jgi:hypothetical protein